jgi:hypothetical protein
MMTIHRIPRVLCILAVGFLLLFGVDTFDPKLSIQSRILGFLIHSTRAFVLMAILLVAWRWELVRGILFAVLGIGFGPFIVAHNYRMNRSGWTSPFVVLIINVPFIVTGPLFVIGHQMKRKQASTGIRPVLLAALLSVIVPTAAAAQAPPPGAPAQQSGGPAVSSARGLARSWTC